MAVSAQGRAGRDDESNRVPFSDVRDYLEARGWIIQKTWPPYVVFMDPRNRRELPRLVEVHDRTVSRAIFEKVKRDFEG